MRLSISTRYAINSLCRHIRRTILSVLGIGVGCGLCLFMVAFIRGEGKMMVKAAAESGGGHLRVVPAEWEKTRDNDLRLPEPQQIYDLLKADESVLSVAPHVRKEALLAFGNRTAGVQIIAVDPSIETSVNRLAGMVAEGQYLSPDETGKTVIGRAIADRLKVGIDDDLMMTAAGADGEIYAAMLRIVGIIETGSEEVDASICHVNLQEIGEITGLDGIGDYTVMIDNPKKMEAIARRIEDIMPQGCKVLTWAEIMPELASGVKVDETWTRLTVAILMIVVFLGISGAQLTAVLERRREFAILSALGMKKIKMINIMFAEGFILGLLGGIAGLVLGTPVTYLMYKIGIDFSSWYGEEGVSMSNLLIDPLYKGDFGWFLVPLAFALSLTATIISSLYPAWYASRTDPAVTLRIAH